MKNEGEIDDDDEDLDDDDEDISFLEEPEDGTTSTDPLIDPDLPDFDEFSRDEEDFENYNYEDYDFEVPSHDTRTNLYLFSVRSSWSPSPVLSEKLQVDQVDNKVLSGKEDEHGRVIVEMSTEPFDPLGFTSLLKASMLHLKQQGKRGFGSNYQSGL
ncbi:hypothetical protein Lser_V15G12158 [Lactuca serriola]